MYLVNKLSFKTSNKPNRHNTTNNKQLIVPFNQKKKPKGNRDFSFTEPSYWNQLPNHIREAENFEKFKKLLKTHF